MPVGAAGGSRKKREHHQTRVISGSIKHCNIWKDNRETLTLTWESIKWQGSTSIVQKYQIEADWSNGD